MEEEKREMELAREMKEEIVSRLSMKDALSTSCLSSGWRYIWVSLPSLDFGYPFFSHFSSFFRILTPSHPRKRHLYSTFVESDSFVVDDDDDNNNDDANSDYDYDSDDEYNDWMVCHAWEITHVGYFHMLDQLWQLYTAKKPSSLGVLKMLSLYVPLLSNSNMRAYAATVVSRWLSLAQPNNVDHLVFWIDFPGLYHPKDSFAALQNCLPLLHSTTLTTLELRGCYLASDNNNKRQDLDITLPCLKQLCLVLFTVDQNTLDTLLSKCPALEKLLLSSCKGFKVLRVPRLVKLRKVKVMHILDLDRVEINAALALQCFTLIKLKGNKCKVKVAANSRTNLVKLVINGCGITDDFFNDVAQFPLLETLTLIDCPKLKHIKISSNSLTRLKIEECPHLGQAELNTPRLFSFRYSSNRNNKVKFKANLIIPQELRESLCPPLGEVQDLSPLVATPLTRHAVLRYVDNLLSFSPQPTTISLRSEDLNSNLLLELQYEDRTKEGESCGCYPDQPINCWRCAMKDFYIVRVRNLA